MFGETVCFDRGMRCPERTICVAPVTAPGNARGTGLRGLRIPWQVN